MSINNIIIVCAVTVGAISGCAQMGGKTSDKEAAASSREKPAEQHGGRLDRNGDRMLSREEAAARPELAKQFDTIDANKDGFIDMPEMRAHHHAAMADHHRNVEERFKQADTDGDGALTKAEAQAANLMPVMHHFDQLDADRNGKVTMTELQAAGMRHGGHGRHGGAGSTEKHQEKQKYY